MSQTQLTGKNIKDASVDLTVDVTGTLPVANGGTGSTVNTTKGGAAILVAASTASTTIKNRADYICTGTSDQTTINTAISALPSGGGKVILSEGTFNLSAAITIGLPGVELIGSGWATILSANNATNMYAITFNPGVGVFCKGTIIRDLKINCNGANQTTGGGGIYGPGIIWSTFENLWIWQPYHNGIYLYTDNNGSFGHHNVVTHCLFEKGEDSPSGDGRAILLASSDENMIVDNTFQQNGRSGATEANHIYDQAGLNTFANNQFVTGQTGIKLQGQHSKALGNMFDGCQNHEMRLNGNKNVVIGNVFYNIGFGGTANSIDGLWIDNVGYNVVMDNLFVPLLNTANCRSGINMQAGATGVTNTLVANNTFSLDSAGTATFATAAIIPGSGAGHIIKNNLGYNSTASKTAAYTALLTDELIIGDATAAAFTVTLPTAVGNKDKIFCVKKKDSTGNAVTVGTTASQTIDGATTYALSTQYYSVTVISDGANWQIVSKIAATGGGGGISAPATTTNTGLMSWNGTTGAAAFDSGVLLSSNNMTFPIDTGVFFKGATDVYLKYVSTGEDALILGNTNAASGKLKLSYTASVNWDLYGTGQVFFMDSAGSTTFNGVRGASAHFRLKGAGSTTSTLYGDATNNRIGILNESPTALLHLGAGTTTANTAPLKLTAGTIMTGAEIGAVEYDGNNFYYTKSVAGTPARRQIVGDNETQTLTNKTLTSAKFNQINDTAGTTALVFNTGGLIMAGSSATPTAKLDIAAGSTSAASLRIEVQTAPTSPNDGDIWNDSTQKGFVVMEAGVKQNIVTTVGTSSTIKTVNTTITETSILGTAVGTYTLPANFFTVGKTIRFTARGYMGSSTSGTLNVKMKLGSTVIMSTGAQTPTASLTNKQWVIQGLITCTATGNTATGKVVGEAYWEYNPADQGTPTRWTASNFATQVLDTTIANVFDLSATWSVSAAANTISTTNFALETLN